ncbi:MAG: nuclear transport factor 2 family protein [Candidatus Freyarchaeum deiterrae]
MSSTSEKNKKIVSDFYNMALNQKKPEEAVSKYMGKVYRQHNPNAGDGPEAFINFVKGFVKQYPELHFDFKRLIAEGDLVVVHSHLKVNPADRGTAVMDIFRVDKGKVVEHWDVLQPIPEKSANKNTMF